MQSRSLCFLMPFVRGSEIDSDIDDYRAEYSLFYRALLQKRPVIFP